MNTALSSEDPLDTDAAELAAKLSSQGERLGLLDNGDLVLGYVPTVGNTVVARVPARDWLTEPGEKSRLILYGDASLSIGDASVVPPSREIRARGTGFRLEGLTNRSATACVDIHGAAFTLCLSRSSPLFTLDAMLSLLLNLLLVAAPALAVIGLYKQSRRERPSSVIQKSKPLGQNAKLELAAANACVGFWDVRSGSGKAWINEETARLLGRQASGNLSDAGFIECFHASHRQKLKDAIDEARPSQAFSIAVPSAASAGETWLELRGSQIYDPDRGTAIISGVVFDVTDTIRYHERQKSSEARLRSAIETFPCPFALWDSKKRLVFWNKTFETMFDVSSVVRAGVSHETVMLARSGNVIHERTSPEDPGTTLLGLRSGEWVKLVERSTNTGTLISFGIDVTNDQLNEERLQRHQKKLKALVQELERSEGHKSELARKYNEEKAKAERSADSKSAFLANMSHELRTPLNAINGFSEILVNEMYGPLGDERYKDYVRDILTSGEHLLDMINDILDIAKIEAGKMTIYPKPIDLVDPVDAAVRMIRRKAEDKGVEVRLQADESLPHIDADHRAVRQMVLNLLSNAIKFTDAGGRITIAVQRRDDFIRVAVRDTGIGIPKEHLPRLAKPFEQVQETRERNFDGTGLGLALTKSFAEMHGGKLTIASEPGKGTMVSFYLPVSTDDQGSDRYVA
ncbi:MAG: PAS domain-containing sensor histidine kinase [Henriciella sp.]|uniref:PAS domain-containing sensor histidine kinase n=1 Tax=Henriciella sp. TaxID=1968823 RepID=UPI0032EDFEAA